MQNVQDFFGLKYHPLQLRTMVILKELHFQEMLKSKLLMMIQLLT